MTWWCADLDYQTIFSESGVIRLFPIFREVDYEDEENDYASDTTTALMYTLGACYCFLGFLCFVGLVCIFFFFFFLFFFLFFFFSFFFSN